MLRNMCSLSIFVLMQLSSTIVASDVLMLETNKKSQIAIVNPINSISYNRLKKYDVNKEGVIINNVGRFASANYLEVNKNLDTVAKTILLEVTGDEPTELKGETKIIGEKAKLILVNPHGISCDGCSFINTSEVELRTSCPSSVSDDQIKWGTYSNGDINIGTDGIVTLDGSLTLDADKIKIDGQIIVKDVLKIAANFNKDKNYNNASYSIIVNTADPIVANRIYLTSKGDGGGIKISRPRSLSDVVKKTHLMLFDSKDDLFIAAEGDIDIGTSIHSANNLKIQGKNISIFNFGSIARSVQLTADNALEIEGDKLDLGDEVKLKSGNGLLKITSKNVVGAGNLESSDGISVLSQGGIGFDSIHSLGDVGLIAKDVLSITKIEARQNDDITLGGSKVDVKQINGARKLSIYGKEISGDFKLQDIKKVEVIEANSKSDSQNIKDFNIVSPLDVAGDFKFVGRNFNNKSVFKASNIILQLSGNFTNDINGEITAKGSMSVVSKSFINYHKIFIDKSFQVSSATLCNDNKGDISAGPIAIFLAGKMDDGKAFSQKSDAILESRNGGIELIAPFGGIYFGYKKEFTGDGDAGDGFRFIGSKLLSHGGDIHIQSGGEVLFEGTQSLGKVKVEAKGSVEARQVNGCYKKGTKQQNCHTVTWCKTIDTPFGCPGGWGYGQVCETVPNFPEVVLKTNFLDEEFYSNKADLIFSKQTAGGFLDPNTLTTDFLNGMAKQCHSNVIDNGKFLEDMMQDHNSQRFMVIQH